MSADSDTLQQTRMEQADTARPLRSDDNIRRDVEEELLTDPKLDASDIAVAVKDGIVTLTGFALSYPDKFEAEEAARRVAGVIGLVNNIEVRLPNGDVRPDPDIARDVAAAIRHSVAVAPGQVRIYVQDGWVRLEGEVEWHFHRQGAERAARHVKGVRGVVNEIRLAPKAPPTEVMRRIKEAFRRSASVDPSRIRAEVRGGEVVLHGIARSSAERDEAERIAWSAPGVTHVDNRIVVSR
jgi:osmotically-inducible protein OsmY